MKKTLLPLMGLICMCQYLAAQENEMNHEHHDHSMHHHLSSQAPIGVMGDHMHHKGSLMVSYRFMWMNMNGNLSETGAVAHADIFANYMVSPQSMGMGMHMLGIMYAPANRMTLMMMGNYRLNSMDLSTGMGVDFTTRSMGFGDLTVSVLMKIVNTDKQSLHGNAGISIPTGGIDKRDATPMMNDAQLAYPMQLGSGTWDPCFGLTYLRQSHRLSWGAQSIYKVRLGQNAENYTNGNRFDIVGWGAYKVSYVLSFSTSLSYSDIQEIEGADADLNPMMMPLFDVTNSGRRQLHVGVGTNYYVAKGIFKNLRIGAEMRIPAYQRVNGIQMKNTLLAIAGAQYTIVPMK